MKTFRILFTVCNIIPLYKCRHIGKRDNIYSFFRKKYEGSNYRDGTTGGDIADNAISPGTLYKYIWKVPQRAGPSNTDGNCLPWAYYSDSYSVEDFYTGLVGPLVVCKKVIYIRIFATRLAGLRFNARYFKGGHSLPPHSYPLVLEEVN